MIIISGYTLITIPKNLSNKLYRGPCTDLCGTPHKKCSVIMKIGQISMVGEMVQNTACCNTVFLSFFPFSKAIGL